MFFPENVQGVIRLKFGSKSTTRLVFRPYSDSEMGGQPELLL